VVGVARAGERDCALRSEGEGVRVPEDEEEGLRGEVGRPGGDVMVVSGGASEEEIVEEGVVGGEVVMRGVCSECKEEEEVTRLSSAGEEGVGVPIPRPGVPIPRPGVPPGDAE
jgi:hypothetical protein